MRRCANSGLLGAAPQLHYQVRNGTRQSCSTENVPASVIDDYGRLMRSVCYQRPAPRPGNRAQDQHQLGSIYPACSTTPRQLDGVISTLDDGYPKDKLYGCHNRTVVVDSKLGEIANKHKQVVVDMYGLRNIHLYEEGEEWIHFEPKAKMLALDCASILKASASP